MASSVGRGLGVTAHGTSGGGNISTEFHLVFQQVVEAAAVYTDENEIGFLTSSLETEACASQLDKHGSAPSVAGAAGSYALSVLRAYQEGAFLKARDDEHAVGLGRDVERYPLIGRGHEFV